MSFRGLYQHCFELPPHEAREGQSSYIPVTGCDENKTGKALGKMEMGNDRVDD